MLKKFLLMIGSLLLILVIVAMLAPFFIQADTFKAQITQQIEKSIGRDVTIAGPIRLKFFPIAGAHLEGVTVAGFPGSPPLMTLKSLDVAVALLPLLKKNVIIKSLDIHEPAIHLQVNKRGENNWQLGKPQSREAGQDTGAGAGAEVLISDVEINNGTVVYHDERTNEKMTLSNADLKVDLARTLTVNGGADWNGEPVKLDVKADSLQLLAGQSARVNADIKSDLLVFTADGEINNRVFAGKVHARSPSLKQLMAWIKPAEKQVAQGAKLAFELNGNAQCSPQHCNLSGAQIALDDIKAQGDIKANWQGERPYIEASLATDMLDFNAFLPPEPAQKVSGIIIGEAFAAQEWSSEPIDLSALRGVDFAATINTGGIKAKKITIGKTTLRVKADRGQLSGDLAEADFYQGRANVNFSADINNPRLSIEKRIMLKGVKVQPFLIDATGSDRLSGTADMQATFTSAGASQRELVGNLGGSGQVKITDGAIKGFNIADMVRNIQAAYKDVDTGARQTDFAELGGTFIIQQGIISNNDLSMKAPLLRLTGQGQINLPQQTIRYRLLPEIVQTAQGQGGKEKQGITVPVIVEGPLEKPAFRPDVEGAVQDAIRDPEKFKQQLKGGKETLKDLKGLLKKF
jgi:AsmA protein